MFTTLKTPKKKTKKKQKNGRKNPPSGTPTLLIHLVLLVQCVPGVTAIKCCSLVGLTFPRIPFGHRPRHLNLVVGEVSVCLVWDIYFPPHVVVRPRGEKKMGEEQHTRYVSTGAAAVLFHSVFRGGFFL